MKWPLIATLNPDIVVACEPQFDETSLDTLRNPLVVFEVATPSTVNDDRWWKSAYYRRCETLVDYVLVAQDQPLVEHYTRQDQDLWGIRELSGLGAILRLPSIGCELPLAQIYARVAFEPDPRMPGDIGTTRD